MLNPAAVRGRDGELYLFPRLVARGNYSRIGIARVRFNADGDPVAVERLGIGLEPTAPYELRADGGGCEDPRITFVEPLKQYVMTYTAFSPNGPRIALAVSGDLFHWERLGLATFAPYNGLEFNGVNNKDALFPGSHTRETAAEPATRTMELDHESIWIAYCRLESGKDHLQYLCHFRSHQRLAAPAAAWECLKIGGGAPPILEPELQKEREGAVSEVVFLTGADRRSDLGLPDRVDIYYGMADSRIGAARLDVPILPS